jgi:MHS family proline/betaine transporter-like MFS transporter
MQEGSSDVQHDVQHVEVEAVRKAVMAAAMGNALEWFDFGVYSYVAVTIGEVFFPTDNKTLSLLASFGVFAVAFLIRPLGGLFWGPLGDKVGRSRVLAATIILMSFGTVAVGLLPGYASIGIWAPVLLVLARLVQGFSTGGEYGGAATFIVESASDRHRGFMASWLEFGTLGGYVLGAVMVQVVAYMLPDQAFADWGWRLPFLVAAPLGLFGLYLRLKLEDSAAFTQLEDSSRVAAAPLKEVFEGHWREMLLCIGLVLILNVAYYTVLSYLPSYLTQVLHMNGKHSLTFLVATMIAMMVVITFIGRLSDRVGRKPVMLASFLGFIFLSFPAFWLLMQGVMWMTIAGLAILGLLVVMLAATMPAALPAIFPTRIRYGGFAISYNVSTSLFGGTAPLVITWLIKETGNDFIPAFYLMLAATIALVPLALIRETAGRRLRGSPAIKRVESA